MAIRGALGASRVRLMRQTLVESLVLSGLGACGGLVLAWWSLAYIRKLIPDALALTGLHLDAKVLAFTAVLTTVTGILAGLGPAVRLSGPATAQTLKEAGRGTAGTSGRSLRAVLVAIEVGVAVILLTNAGLLIRTLSLLRGLDPGFRPDHVLCARTNLPAAAGARYHDPARREAFYQRVITSLKETPGVLAAGYVSYLPLTHRGGTTDLVAEGRPAPRPGESVDANLRVVTPDYLPAIGVAVVSGRELTEHDGPEALPAAVVNQAMAREYWAGENPVGRRFRLGSEGADSPWITVVGVVRDIRQMGLDVPAHPEMYLSYRQFAASYGFFAPRDLAVRTSGDLAPLAAVVRRAVAEADPEQPVSRLQPMDSLLASELGPRSLQTNLLAGFAAFALFLASLGIYGVLSYTLSQRIPEMGLRLALGAQPADVIRSILASGLRPVAAGLAVGLPGAWLLARMVKGLLYYVSPFEPLTFSIVTLLLVGVATAASYLPARAAAAIQPMRALRSE
jgi:putative ABC transport system permease protein